MMLSVLQYQGIFLEFCCIMLFYAIVCYVVLCYVIFCCIMLDYVASCFIIPFYVILWYVLFCSVVHLRFVLCVLTLDLPTPSKH